MKKIITTSILFLVAACGYSQVSTAPNGDVGIGTTSPEAKLHVNGATRTDILTLAEGGSTQVGYLGRGGAITSGWIGSPNILSLNYINRDFAIGGWGKTNNAWMGAALYINSDNNNVGIGTITPEYKLAVAGTQTNNWNGLIAGPNGQGAYFAHGGGYGMHVNAGTNASASTYVLEAYSNDQSRFYVRGDGNVGIGTNAPDYNLHVVGKQSNNWNGLITGPNGQGAYFAHGGGYGMHVNAGTNASASTYIFEAYSNNLSRFYIRGDGNVGIGTNNPSEMLSVNGKIRAREVKVENINWPDYVFTPSFKLPDLKVTEQFIKENNHLPEIPSAAEVAKDGVNLGEMNELLLKKIEELTLYMIEKDKEVKELKSRLDKLEKKN